MMNLGPAVAAFQKAMEIDPTDYALALAGDCMGEVARYHTRNLDRVAQRYGFRDASHLRQELERRVSHRWIYHNVGF